MNIRFWILLLIVTQTGTCIAQQIEKNQLKAILAELPNGFNQLKGDTIRNSYNFIYYFKSKLSLPGTKDNIIKQVNKRSSFSAVIADSTNMDSLIERFNFWKKIIKEVAPGSVDYFMEDQGNPCCPTHYIMLWTCIKKEGEFYTKYYLHLSHSLSTLYFSEHRKLYLIISRKKIVNNAGKLNQQSPKDEITPVKTIARIQVFSSLTGNPLNDGIFLINGKQVDVDSLGFIPLYKPDSTTIHFLALSTSVGQADTTFEIKDSLVSIILKPEPGCPSKEQAEKDISHGEIKLIVRGGLKYVLPCTPTISEAAQKRFGIKLDDYSCSTLPPYDCVLLYNTVVIKHLDKKYGNSWRSEVKGNIIGLPDVIDYSENWKKFVEWSRFESDFLNN